MLQLFGLNINEWVVKTIMAVLLIAVLAGGYFIWKHDVVSAAQTVYNNQQLTQTIKDKDRYIETLKEIADTQDEQIINLNGQNAALQTNITAVRDYLQSSTAKAADRPSSEVLKHTIEILSGKKK